MKMAPLVLPSSNRVVIPKPIASHSTTAMTRGTSASAGEENWWR